KEYVSYIIKNSQRISDYTKALMEMNKSNKLDGLNLKKVKVSEIIERVSTIAREITLIHDRSISKSINCEDGDIMIDMKLFERVIQNIF
ncbi:two-component sensor histidine kinase, partial [Enterococcus faecium]